MIKYNLGFGNSPAVREAFIETYGGNHGFPKPVSFGPEQLDEMDYPRHDGDPELIEITRQVIKRQIGKEYKHVFLTNGATGGVVIALRAYAKRKYWVCHTRQAPHYMRYPGMISAGNMTMVDELYPQWAKDSVILLDIPSNPLGRMTEIHRKGLDIPIILDGVYYNNVYVGHRIHPVDHDVFVGSYSKLLGLNGVRIGWVATNDDLLAFRMSELITAEYCGLSVPSTTLLKEILKDFRWDLFESRARLNLNFNREDWSKLERFFGGQSVSEYGMFYYGPTDQKCKALLEKAGVGWIGGEKLGTDENFGRFNLGQRQDVLRKAVRDVLEKDRIK